MVTSLFICLAPLTSIGGIVCGHLARRDLRRNPALRGSRMALTGLIAGYFFTILGIGGVIFYLQRDPSNLGPPNREGRTTIIPGNTAKVAQPSKPVTGIVGSRKFRCEDATLESGWLRLRQGADAQVAVVLVASNREVEGKTYTVGPGGRGTIPALHVNWKAGSTLKSFAVSGGYTMKLQFGKFENGTVRGQIDLQVPGPINSVSIQGEFIAVLK
jgi:hypothetical protein